MTEALDPLWSAMEAREPILSPVGWRQIPTTTRSSLISAGLVIKGPAVRRVRCPVCVRPHYEAVYERPGPSGTVRHFIHCPREFRVRVSDADRQAWKIDVTAVAASAARCCQLEGNVRPMGSDRLYHCGRHVQHGMPVEVYLARGFGRHDAQRIAQAIPRGVLPPIIFVPRQHPHPSWLADADAIVFALSSLAQFQDGVLTVSGGVVAHAAARLLRDSSLADNIFRCRGAHWEIRFNGGEMRSVSNDGGMTYIAQLLAEPRRAFPAVELLASRTGVDPRAMEGSSGKAMDPKTRAEMKKAFQDLIAEREEAERNNDRGRLDLLDRQIQTISSDFANRLGLGGKSREATDADKIRRSVKMSLTRAVEKVAKEIPTMGLHLDTFIDTGFICTYKPDKTIEWAI